MRSLLVNNVRALISQLQHLRVTFFPSCNPPNLWNKGVGGAGAIEGVSAARHVRSVEARSGAI